MWIDPELARDRPVYRYFSLEEHADGFVRGQVWISTLDTCRRTEDNQRRDIGEGGQVYSSGSVEGSIDDPEIQHRLKNMRGIEVDQGDHITISDIDIITELDGFVICTSSEYSGVLAEKFGQYCVMITDPVRLFQIVTKNILRFYSLFPRLGRVRYADREYSKMENRPGVAGFVKPQSFQNEKEIRFLWARKWAAVQKGGVVLPSHMPRTTQTPFLFDIPELSSSVLAKGPICRRIR